MYTPFESINHDPLQSPGCSCSVSPTPFHPSGLFRPVSPGCAVIGFEWQPPPPPPPRLHIEAEIQMEKCGANMHHQGDV